MGERLRGVFQQQATAMLCRDFEVSRPKDAPPMEEIYNFTVGPTHVYATMSPRRSIRGGIDIEFREKDRRANVLSIDFPERRVAERRKQDTATVR